MNRLRVQLVLAFSLVVLIAVGAIATLVLRTTDRPVLAGSHPILSFGQVHVPDKNLLLLNILLGQKRMAHK